MRVRFVLTRFALESGKLIGAVREVFGNRTAKYANSSRDVTVECSAERFVRFQIARNNWGATNGFKDLQLEIIEPKPNPKNVIESYD
jgi:hypothetical protein